MPGSETTLEELISSVLCNLLQDGTVAKVPHDLYSAEKTSKLLHNCKSILSVLQAAGLTLSAHKITIAPKSTIVLGLIWSQRIATLSTCSRRTTVKAVQSLLGAYKFISRVIPKSSSFLFPLEIFLTGKLSLDDIMWTKEMSNIFHQDQQHLHSQKSIIHLKADDQLWLFTDGVGKTPGLGLIL